MPKSELFNREDVLEKAIATFWQKGYHGTSMQDLVDAMGINRSSVYNSFGDKFNLLVESLRHYQEQQREISHTLIAESPSAIESIRLILMAFVDYQSDQPKGCFLTNCTTELGAVDRDMKGLLSENKESMHLFFKDLIIQGQKEGAIDATKDADVLSSFLFSSLQGLRVSEILSSDNQEVEKVIDHIIDSLR